VVAAPSFRYASRTTGGSLQFLQLACCGARPSDPIAASISASVSSSRLLLVTAPAPRDDASDDIFGHNFAADLRPRTLSLGPLCRVEQKSNKEEL
jgi:hypothetical protein